MSLKLSMNKGDNMTKEQAIEKVFDKANLIGIDANLYALMNAYKVLRLLPDTEYEQVYEDLVERLGFNW